MSRRVEPYLHGLAGRPSRLLIGPTSVRWGWAIRLLGRAGSHPRMDLLRRLEGAGRPPDQLAFKLEQLAWGAGAFAAVVVASVLGAIAGMSSSPVSSGLVGAIAGTAGFLGRDWFLSKEVDRRVERMRDELPTAIDHMTLALLAGEAIPAAFARVAGTARGVVGEEFDRVAGDMRSGIGVLESLDAFRQRVPDAAVARFVDAMCAAVERGTSLSDVLRAQADDVRDAHRRRLLEMGGRREVWMLIPIVFLIMPVIVLFALYPGLVSLDLLVR